MKRNKRFVICAGLLNDAGAWTDSSWYDVPNSWSAVEIHYQAFANSGSLTLWLDDAQKQSLTFIDNDTRTLTDVRLGAQGVDTNTSGTIYFDDFESRRFSYIGTLTDPGVDDPTATNQAGWFARTYQYSATIPHAVTSVNPETGSPDTYSYDANGNMTCRIENGVTYTHTYNAENRASSIAKRDGDCDTGTIIESWSFAYDGDGVRVGTVHFTGTSGTPDSTTSYYMGGAYEVKDSAVKKYYSIAGMMVAVKDGSGLQYLLTDHLGSTVAVTNSSGTLTSQQRYLPFGAPRTIPNSPILVTDFTFTGQRDLGDMGLMDYDARFYSQSLGRFIQPDTIIANSFIPQTWNRYASSINNPIKFVDPSGHFIETAFDILSIGMDIADIAQNGLNLANGAALVLDVASAVIPGVPALGGLILKASKAAKAVSTATDAAKLVNKADNIADTAKALKNGAEELGTCLVNSFRADTDVETSDGPRDISTIQIGDYVLAWDEASGTLGYYEVTNAFHHTDAVVTDVILSGEWIETTPEHPFYVEGEGWVEAEDLQIGDQVRQADGTTGIVWLKWYVYKTQEMYNLTVDTAHTFFVGEGQWLVHNACQPFDVGKVNELKPNSIGDNLDVHHVPQSHPAAQIIPGYNPSTAPGIALPDYLHEALAGTNLRGPYVGTARDLLAKNIWDLHKFKVPNSALKSLIDLNKRTFPRVFLE